MASTAEGQVRETVFRMTGSYNMLERPARMACSIFIHYIELLYIYIYIYIYVCSKIGSVDIYIYIYYDILNYKFGESE